MSPLYTCNLEYLARSSAFILKLRKLKIVFFREKQEKELENLKATVCCNCCAFVFLFIETILTVSFVRFESCYEKAFEDSSPARPKKFIFPKTENLRFLIFCFKLQA